MITKYKASGGAAPLFAKGSRWLIMQLCFVLIVEGAAFN